jgi:hypothetical protein
LISSLKFQLVRFQYRTMLLPGFQYRTILLPGFQYRTILLPGFQYRTILLPGFQYRTILLSARSERSVAEQKAIGEVVAAGDPDAAEGAMRTHLSHVAEALRGQQSQ